MEGEGMVRIQVLPGIGGPEAADARDKCVTMIRAYCARAGWACAERAVGDAVHVDVFNLLDVPPPALAAMHGVHRFVGISPHDPQHRRQTSFASVYVEGCRDRFDQARSELGGAVKCPAEGWPSESRQIRSYVTEPYRMAKDHVTGAEADVQAVLAGEIDRLVTP